MSALGLSQGVRRLLRESTGLLDVQRPQTIMMFALSRSCQRQRISCVGREHRETLLTSSGRPITASRAVKAWGWWAAARLSVAR